MQEGSDFKKIKKLKNQSGFTLIETLVSLLVLSLGLIPTLTVITSSINISRLITNNLIAANLAQEGVEVTRSLRDANWFRESPNFYDGLIGSWRVDWNSNWTNNLPKTVTVENNPFLKFDSVTGLYNYSIGTDTPFKRLITITLTANTCNCELVVVSQVSWSDSRRTRTVQIESHLFNWR